MDRRIVGKFANQLGITPSIGLVNPKYPRNVAACIRAASCFGVKQVWYSGNRIQIEEGERLPREERMKGYSEVDLIQYDYFVDQFKDVTPVAIEISPTAEVLTTFDHPENPLYIFGPEDGSIPQTFRKLCHRFVIIPTNHCTNLSAAVYLVLYDRLMKRQLAGKEAIIPASQVIKEDRGYTKFEEASGMDYKQKMVVSDYV